MSVAGSHLCPLSASPPQSTVTEQKPAAGLETHAKVCACFNPFLQIIIVFGLLNSLAQPSKPLEWLPSFKGSMKINWKRLQTCLTCFDVTRHCEDYVCFYLCPQNFCHTCPC